MASIKALEQKKAKAFAEMNSKLDLIMVHLGISTTAVEPTEAEENAEAGEPEVDVNAEAGEPEGEPTQGNPEMDAKALKKAARAAAKAANQ